MNVPLKESLKEVGRLIIFSALGIAIDYFTGVPGEQAMVIVIVLRGIDKFIHKSDKTSLNGLLPF